MAPSKTCYAFETSIGVYFRVLPAVLVQFADFATNGLVILHFFETDHVLYGFVALSILFLSMVPVQFEAWSTVVLLLTSAAEEGEELDGVWEMIRSTIVFAVLAPFQLHSVYVGLCHAGAEAAMAAMCTDVEFSRKRYAWLETAARKQEGMQRFETVCSQTKELKSRIARDRWYLVFERIEYLVKKHMLEQRLQHLQRTHLSQNTEEIRHDRVDHVKSKIADLRIHEEGNVVNALRRLKEQRDQAKVDMQRVKVAERKAIQEAKLHNIARTSPQYVRLQARSARMKSALVWSKAVTASMQSLPLAMLTTAKLSSEIDAVDNKERSLLLSSIALSILSMAFGFFGATLEAKSEASFSVHGCNPTVLLAISLNVVWTLSAIGLCFGAQSLKMLRYLLPAANLAIGMVLFAILLLLSLARFIANSRARSGAQSGFNRLSSSLDDASDTRNTEHKMLSSAILATVCACLANSVTDVLSLVPNTVRESHDRFGFLKLMSVAAPILRRCLLVAMAALALGAAFSSMRLLIAIPLCLCDAVAAVYLWSPSCFSRRAVPTLQHARPALQQTEAEVAGAAFLENDEASVAHQGVVLSVAPASAAYFASGQASFLERSGAGSMLEVAAEGLNDMMSSRLQGARHHHHQASQRALSTSHHRAHHGPAGRGKKMKRKPRVYTRTAPAVRQHHALPPARSASQPEEARAGVEWLLLSSLCAPQVLADDQDARSGAASAAAGRPLDATASGWRASSAAGVRCYVAQQHASRRLALCVAALRAHAERALARAEAAPAPAAVAAALRELQRRAADMAAAAAAVPCGRVRALQRAVDAYSPSTRPAEEGAEAERRLLQALEEASMGAEAVARTTSADQTWARGTSADQTWAAGAPVLRATTLEEAGAAQTWATERTAFGECAVRRGGESAGGVERCGCYVSHSWHEPSPRRRRKRLVLLHQLRLRSLLSSLVLCSLFCALVLLPLGFAVGASSEDVRWWCFSAVPLGVLACSLLWTLASAANCVPARWTPWAASTVGVWIDSLCVDAAQAPTGQQRWAVSSEAMKRSDSIVALVSASYFERLWCVTELAFAAREHSSKLTVVALDWPLILNPRASQLTEGERGWFADFTCGGAQCLTPSDCVALRQAIREAFGTEEAFEQYVRDELPKVMQESKHRHAWALWTSLQDQLSSMLGC